MQTNRPVTELIRQRFSCRTYLSEIISVELLQSLSEFVAVTRVGPLGNQSRFELVAAAKNDNKALRGLGTYGFIKGATGFLVGATIDKGKALEDFGYLMEKIILYATDLGLGTCWLGGSFSRSRFAKKISLQKSEIIPAITSLGYIAEKPGRVDAFIRKEARGDQRRPWDWMFFNGSFDEPLPQNMAADYFLPLEMIRLGPSASNLQPWRIIHIDGNWHFYLRRKSGYRNSRSAKILRTADLQRVDMGIAMCHFEMTARSLGLLGQWMVAEPDIQVPDRFTEYTVSWFN